MSYKRIGNHTTSKSRFGIEAPPLGFAELVLCRRFVTEVAPGWSAELHGVCAAEACLILMPESADDLSGASFIVTREGYGFRVDEVRWDVMTDAGVYGSLAELLESIQSRMITDAAAVAWPSTIH